jgi:phage shock protein A
LSFSSRFVNLIKQKVNKVLEKHEDPREALDYSAVKQTELIQRLRREIVEVVASKKRLEMQKARLLEKCQSCTGKRSRYPYNGNTNRTG